MSDLNSASLDGHQMSSRVVLFLQGSSSPLFSYIADELRRAGVTCLRINFNVGDQVFWRRSGATNYRGTFDEWGGFIRSYLGQHKVTDVIALGEERPYHKIAFDQARALGIKVYVVEMGYLRPDWMTFEREGMSSNSRFPVDPDYIMAHGQGLNEPDWTPKYRQTFLAEAALELAYNLPNVFLWYLFPNYERYGIYHPLREYWGWCRKLISTRKRHRVAQEVVNGLACRQARYFVYALQLQTDFQLRVHSPYRAQQEAIAQVIQSFALHAPADTELILKIHPLDSGLEDWPAYTQLQSEKWEVAGRVHIIDGGDFGELARGSRGVVSVNSTASLHALRDLIPVKVLGAAIYDIHGLTEQRSLDSFWEQPQAPDSQLVSSFYRLLAHSIQVRGNLYSRDGAKAAAKEIAHRLATGKVNVPHAYIDPAPRAKPAKVEI